MPGMDGLEATRLPAGPRVEEPMRIVVITPFDLAEYVHGELKAGARGFLLKAAGARSIIPGDSCSCERRGNDCTGSNYSLAIGFY
ncbi:MAG: hypothetical protein QF590_05815 [Dehalococcoidia bacterium]|nr:hypothetical protein [Dehalococcoidia bacterium]MDP7090797.1 hypothetical protein [Dehalococcoidia bacterium]MDP7262136.1 hypothetical protein [Dehalococcoidia bacterium]MDP7486338.1 hypothetical protein [Dehalococcoidia bacterium]